MKFPITVTEFDEQALRVCGDVAIINTAEEFEVAKTKWTPYSVYTYTFTDVTGKWIKV